jgi:sugar transferase (PEP-CTERM system associated)
MIRIFNHYIHRQTALQVLFDGVLLVCAVLGLLAIQLGQFELLLPIATTHVLSLTAGVLVIGTASGMYQRAGHLTRIQSFARAALMLVLALPLTYGILALLPEDLPNRQAIQLAAMGGLAAVVVRRVYLLHWGAQASRRTRTLIFGAGPAAVIVADTLRQSDPHVEIVGFYAGPNEREPSAPLPSVLPTSRSLIDTAQQLGVDEIVVALTERRAGSMPLRQLLDCKLLGIKVYDISTHFEKRLGQIRVDFVNAGWLIFGDGFNQDALRSMVKRTFDILFSTVLIVAATPVMLLTSLLIKLDSRGPVLYTQERVGQNGSTFMVAKFRSMRTDAEKDGTPRWATASDDRVTRVGSVIRKLRIDELPQLFNVLKGEMSLVGPRPERPFFVEQLTEKIPYFAVRHSVKPGVTGWAQVRYQYGATVEDSQEKLQYDLYYVKNHSLFLDLVVLFETVGVVLTGKGAR